MDQGPMNAGGTASNLLTRYRSLREEEPKLFVRDAAKRLGVSEGELVAARCGLDVVRLDCRWEDLVSAMPSLGRVMTLARNDWAVHERKGVFRDVRIGRHGGIVLGPEIDLRINFSKWRSGFAVKDLTSHGERNSLQVFDAAGTAVQKIHRLDETNAEAWDALVEAHRAEDQTPGQTASPAEPIETDGPDEAVDVEALRGAWRSMTDVHQFFGILREYDVRRVQAFRLVGAEFARHVGNDGFRRALESAAAAEVPVMIFVPSPGLVQIHTGPVVNLEEVGAWFNVLDPDFNLHLLPEGIASTWVVQKPTKDGIVTSVETFDADGNQIAWMFGKRSEGGPEREDWRALAESLAER